MRAYARLKHPGQAHIAAPRCVDLQRSTQTSPPAAAASSCVAAFSFHLHYYKVVVVVVVVILLLLQPLLVCVYWSGPSRLASFAHKQTAGWWYWEAAAAVGISPPSRIATGPHISCLHGRRHAALRLTLRHNRRNRLRYRSDLSTMLKAVAVRAAACCWAVQRHGPPPHTHTPGVDGWRGRRNAHMERAQGACRIVPQ